MIEDLKYFIKEGFRSIWINRMMSFASILVLCICLVMLGTTLLTTFNINSFVTQLESKNQVMVFLDKKAKADDITRISNSINSMSNIRSSKFITNEQNYQLALKEFGKQKIMLNGINSSAFPCSYQVKFKDLTKYSQTVSALEAIKGVEYVSQDEGLASKLTDVKKGVSIAGFWLFVILAVISLFIISNTIKLALFGRKREVNIMKFVGATDWFIRWPFIIEGLMIGIISAFLALIAQYYVYTGLICGAIKMLNVVKPLNYGSELWIIFPGFLVGGIIVGALGSVLSVRRYLKV